MIAYALKRLLLAIPTIVLATVVVFTVMRVIPGDPAQLLAGDVRNPERIAAIRAEHGLDKSIPAQYAHWISRVARLDFGESVRTREPALDLILRHFSVTAQIVLAAVTVAVALSLTFGILAARHQDSPADLVTVGVAVLLMSIPSFWLGTMFIFIFGVELRWLATIGYVSLQEDFWQGLRYLILPVTVLALTESGPILRMVRSTMIEQLRMEYVEHARARGVRERAILLRHALRNTLAPVSTLVGLVLGALLGGAAVIETVFTVPGIGRLLVTSIFARDYPVVQGIMIFSSAIYVFINLLVDLLRPMFDPRSVLR